MKTLENPEWCRCCEYHKSYICAYCAKEREKQKHLFPEVFTQEIHPKKEKKTFDEMIEHLQETSKYGYSDLDKIKYICDEIDKLKEGR